jgi:hypothetical protein
MRIPLFSRSFNFVEVRLLSHDGLFNPKQKARQLVLAGF